MKLRACILVLFLIILCQKSLAQNSIDCNPYYNGHLHKCHNSEQVDFSQEYMKYLTNNAISKDLLAEFSTYLCDSVWLTANNQQNGVIGKNYQRIHIHISDVFKSEKCNIYFVKGKSKVNHNICDFSGKIEVLKLFCNKCDYDESSQCCELIGKYTLYEDSLQSHSGVFKGIMSCEVFIDDKNHRIMLDESMDVSDGYSNRDFVGTWTDYKTGISKNVFGEIIDCLIALILIVEMVK
jgi:hypothetical protein